MNCRTQAIGGYFELECPPARSELPQGHLRFQSARAAFLALINECPSKRVWLPRYLCNAMIEPVETAGKELCFYSVDEQLNVPTDFTPETEDLLLMVDYFGLSMSGIRHRLIQLDPMRVVIDCSQSWYANPPETLGSIFSARKFFGVPDGGLLKTKILCAAPSPADDEGSLARSQHLLKRLGGSAESGYATFQSSEASLEKQSPQAMSQLTIRMLESIEMERARSTRLANFHHLHQALRTSNTWTWAESDVTGPLCYPYVTEAPGLRQKLAQNRIYTPTYWPEVLTRKGSSEIECRMARNCIPLPCDQRYTTNDMDHILEVIKECTKHGIKQHRT